MAVIVIEFSTLQLPEEMLMLDEDNKFHHWISTSARESIYQLCTFLRGHKLLVCNTLKEKNFLVRTTGRFQSKQKIGLVSFTDPWPKMLDEENHLISSRIKDGN